MVRPVCRLATIALLVVLSPACRESSPPPLKPAAKSPAVTKAAPASTRPAARVDGDPEKVPDFRKTPACTPGEGDAVGLKKRLKTIERRAELPPPSAASLTAGCPVPREQVVASLVRAAQQLGKKRDWSNAAAYAKLAIEIDPGAPEPRLALAVARSQIGSFEGAIHQLKQWQAAHQGKGPFASLVRERGLEPLRARRAFWTWASQPPPALVSSLRGEPRPAPLKERDDLELAFPKPIGSKEDLVFEQVRLTDAELGVVAAAISAEVGRELSDYHLATSDDLSGEALKIPGTSLIAGAQLFRFTPTKRLLAVSLAGSFKADDGQEKDANVSVLAVEKEPGKYAVVELICSRLGCHCDDSALRVSLDRQALAWIKECPDRARPASWERCVVYGEPDKLVKKCELLSSNSSSGGGESWRSCTAGDSDFNDE